MESTRYHIIINTNNSLQLKIKFHHYYWPQMEHILLVQHIFLTSEKIPPLLLATDGTHFSDK